MDVLSAPGATFVDVLPAGLTFQSYTAPATWSCTASGQQVSCRYTGLPVSAGNGLPPVVISVNVVAPPGPFENCAVLRADLDPANNRSCVHTVTYP